MAGSRRSGVRREPYRWLGAGTVALGIGFVLAGGAGAAHADDGTAGSAANSSDPSTENSVERESESGQTTASDPGAGNSFSGEDAHAPEDATEDSTRDVVDEQSDNTDPIVRPDTKRASSRRNSQITTSPGLEREVSARTEQIREPAAEGSLVPAEAKDTAEQISVSPIEGHPDPSPAAAAPELVPADAATEFVTAGSTIIDSGSPAPVLTGLPWVALAATRRELGVGDRDAYAAVTPAVSATAAATPPPSVSAPDPVTGTVTGIVAPTTVDGTKLTYKLSAPPSIGTLSFNAKAGSFTYTPTASQRVLAGLSPGVDTVDFAMSVSDGKTTVPMTVSVTIAPVTIAKLGQVNTGADGLLGVAVTNTRAYLANVNDQTITVIDTIHRTVIGTIPSAGVSTLAVKPDGTRLYAINSDGGTVTVIDTASLTAIGSPIEVGRYPMVAVPSPDSKILYVSNYLDATVTKINTATNKVIGTVRNVGAGPALLAVSPDGKKIYVSNPETDVVTWFSPTSSTARPVIGLPAGLQPFALTISSDNKTLYVGSYYGTVAVVDTTTNAVTAVFEVPDAVGNMALSKDGSLLLAENGSGKLLVISTTTRSLLTTVTLNPEWSAGAASTSFVGMSTDGMQFYMTDGSAEALQVISLVPPNTKPTATTTVNPPAATGEVGGKVTGNDVDGDRLTYRASMPAKGTVALQADGSFTYTPSTAARHEAARSGAPAGALRDTFIVTVDDGRRGIITVPVTVNIAPANNVPVVKTNVARPAAATGAVRGTITATDKDKDTLAYAASTTGGKGSVTIDAKGVFTYTPTAAARHAAAALGAGSTATTDTVTITVNDAHGGIETRQLTVTISPRNAVPTIPGVQAGQPDSNSGQVRGALGVTDTDNDPLTYSAPTATKKGTIVVHADGTFTYTPSATALAAARAAGASRASKTDTFTITVDDGHGGKKAVTVSVAFVNAAPVGGTPTIGTAYGATGSMTGKVVFTDADRDKLSYGTSGTPSQGTVVVKADGTFTYTPSPTARLTAGLSSTTVTDAFAITATDAYGLTTSVNVVVPIDPARHIVTGSAIVGNAPSGIAFSRDGSRAYVANYADGTLTVINTATMARIGSPIKVKVLPDSIAVSADGTHLYVLGLDAATNAGKAVAVNTATGKEVGAPIAVGPNPSGIAVHPDGTRVYVTNGGDGTVTVIDTATLAVTGAPITVGANPTAIAIAPNGSRAYVTNGGANTVTVIDMATGAAVGSPIAVGVLPVGIALSPDGSRAYIANSNAGTVSVINTATNTLVGAAIPVGANPQAISMSPDGARVYVIGADGAMSVIGTATNTVVGPPLSVGWRPYGLAVNSDGSRIFATTSDGRLTAVSFTSTQNAPVAPVAPGPATTTSNGSVAGSLGVTDTSKITYTVTMRPGLGTVTVKADGSYTYTPTAAARQYASSGAVTDTFTINATNARGASTSVTITVNVSPAKSVAAVPPKLIDPVVAYNTVFEVDRPVKFLAHPNGLRGYTINSVELQYGLDDPDSISVIDTVTNEVIGEPIRIGDLVGGATLTPDGNFLYVVRKYFGDVWVLDTRQNNAKVAELKVGMEPGGILSSTDGKRMYVFNTGLGTSQYPYTVSVINTDSKTVIGGPITLTVPQPKSAWTSKDNTRLFVLSGSTIDVIDTNSLKVIKTIAVGESFGQSVLSPNGKTMYLASQQNTRVLAVDTVTGAVSTRMTYTNYYFQHLVLNPDGTRLYATTGDRNLAVFDTASGALLTKKAFDGIPLAMSISSDGKRVYAMNYVIGVNGTGTRLVTLDTATETLIGSPLAVGDSYYTQMTISPDGSRVYIPAALDGGTYVVDTGRPATAVAETISTSAGDLYDRLRRLTDYPYTKDGLAIEQVEVNGTKRVIVYFGGTVGQFPDAFTATRSWQRNAPLYLAGHVDRTIVERIDTVLKDMPATTEILFVGYSQGGMDAQNVAAAWKAENRRGRVTTVVTYAAPIIRPPGADAEHVIHLRANFDPVPTLGGFYRAVDEAQWSALGHIFAVNANVPPTLDLFKLHGQPSTYIDVGRQFDAVSSTMYPTIRADLAKYAGTLLNYRQY